MLSIMQGTGEALRRRVSERMGQVSWLHLIAFAIESLTITLPIKMMANYVSNTVDCSVLH